MAEPILVIMAAGMGKRYGGLKQIEPITAVGEIIIDFSLYDAFQAGFRRAVFIIKREMEADVRRLIDGRAGSKFEVSYVFQDMDELPEGARISVNREKPWGTSHAVWCARNAIDAPFAVINADDYYGLEAFKLIFDYLKSVDPNSQDYAMVSYLLGKTLTDSGAVTRGICEVVSDGMLISVTERKKIMRRDEVICYADERDEWQQLGEDTPASMNFWGRTPAVFDELERRFHIFLDLAGRSGTLDSSEYLLPTTVNNMLRDGSARVRVFPCSARWHGVTYPEDKTSVSAALERLKLEGRYPERLWEDKNIVGRQLYNE
jgi:NDP-sugar pyrophosphorylase family protein